jgi:hypothetical protein
MTGTPVMVKYLESIEQEAGINYPWVARQWLTCSGSECGRSGCPGHPTNAHGFASEEKSSRFMRGEKAVVLSLMQLMTYPFTI